MFRLQRTPSYWWPVEVAFATDGGQYERETLEVQFVRLDIPALNALMEEARTTPLLDDAVAARVVLDWRGVQDDTGQVVPFSGENLARVCRLPGVATAIARAFLDSHTEAGAGNSSRPPKHGRAAA